jgi:hypothetical protein
VLGTITLGRNWKTDVSVLLLIPNCDCTANVIFNISTPDILFQCHTNARYGKQLLDHECQVMCSRIVKKSIMQMLSVCVCSRIAACLNASIIRNRCIFVDYTIACSTLVH